MKLPKQTESVDRNLNRLVGAAANGNVHPSFDWTSALKTGLGIAGQLAPTIAGLL